MEIIENIITDNKRMQMIKHIDQINKETNYQQSRKQRETAKNQLCTTGNQFQMNQTNDEGRGETNSETKQEGVNRISRVGRTIPSTKTKEVRNNNKE